MIEEEVITVSQVCKNVFHVPYKPKVIHLQNLKNSFREVYLCLSPHRMFSITEEEWSELSSLMQDAVSKWNLLDSRQMVKIKWTLHTCSVKFEKSNDGVFIILGKKASIDRNKLWLKMCDIDGFCEYLNDVFDDAIAL